MRGLENLTVGFFMRISGNIFIKLLNLLVYKWLTLLRDLSYYGAKPKKQI